MVPVVETRLVPRRNFRTRDKMEGEGGTCQNDWAFGRKMMVLEWHKQVAFKL